MELEERLSYLENVRDWQSLVEELEKGIASSAANAAKAQFHLKLGRVLETKFLAGVKALKHFQDAYKLNPALTESLEAARNVYWELGKLNMVQKLLELELKAGAGGARASALLLELGDVLCDQGDWEKAAATYARSIGMFSGQSAEPSACLGDVQLESANWQEHLATLLRAVSEKTDGAAKARILLRAARVARRFAPEEAEGLIARAYAADALNRQAAALYEGLLAEQGRFDTLEQTQNQILQQTDRSVAPRIPRARRWGRAGSCATRTSTRAPVSSRRRSGSTPRTRGRSSTCGRRTARRAATGTASSPSPRKRRHERTTGGAPSSWRRRGSSRGASSATSFALGSPSSALARSRPSTPTFARSRRRSVRRSSPRATRNRRTAW